MKFKAPSVYLSTLLLLISAFYILTLRPGHNWGDDFAMYIAHARNIMTGHSYMDTGLIFDPTNPSSPKAYPFVFPLLLAPVYGLFGLNLEAMKIEMILFFIVALAAIYTAAKNVAWGWRLGIVAMIGLHPFFWLMKDNILSDIPFLMFCYLTFACFGSRYRWVSGLFTALAVGTRLVGLALPLAWIAHYAIQRKKPDRALILMLVLSNVAALINWLSFEHVWKTGRIGSFDLLFSNIQRYAAEANAMWPLFAVFVGLALWGIWKKREKVGWELWDFFGVFYMLGLICSVFYEYARYLIPVIPVGVYYSFLGLSKISKPLVRTMLIGVIGIGAATTFIRFYRTAPFGPQSDGVMQPAAQELFEYIRTQTRETDRIVFHKPRALALYTRRSASFFPPDPQTDLGAFIEEIKAGYLVTTTAPEDRYNYLAVKNPAQYRRVYQNSHFNVWKVLGS